MKVWHDAHTGYIKAILARVQEILVTVKKFYS